MRTQTFVFFANQGETTKSGGCKSGNQLQFGYLLNHWDPRNSIDYIEFPMFFRVFPHWLGKLLPLGINCCAGAVVWRFARRSAAWRLLSALLSGTIPGETGPIQLGNVWKKNGELNSWGIHDIRHAKSLPKVYRKSTRSLLHKGPMPPGRT